MDHKIHSDDGDSCQNGNSEYQEEFGEQGPNMIERFESGQNLNSNECSSHEKSESQQENYASNNDGLQYESEIKESNGDSKHQNSSVGDDQQIQSNEEINTVHKSENSADSIRQHAQQLIEEINEKRKQDSNLISDFRKSFDIAVEKICRNVEQKMFSVYEGQSSVMQTKLGELFNILDHIEKLNDELNDVKQALGSLYQDVH